MVQNIADLLDQLAGYGVFSYAIPFLLLFAITYGILIKTQIFGPAFLKKSKDGNETEVSGKMNGIYVIISLAVGLLGIMNGYVPTFFSELIPKAGVALGVLLVIIIFLGFFLEPAGGDPKKGLPSALGWVLGVVVILWAWSEWGDKWGLALGSGTWGYNLVEYLPLILFVVIIGLIVAGISGGFGDK
jgi:hypothetical protein